LGCDVADRHAGRGAALWRLPDHRDGADHARGAARRALRSFGRDHSVGNARMARQSSSNPTKKCELFSSGIFFQACQKRRFTSARSICNVASTNLPHPNVGRGRCSI
jgi:hypothetical protein